MDSELDKISGSEYDPVQIVPLLKTRFYDATGREKTRLAYALAKFGQRDIPYFCSTIINSPPRKSRIWSERSRITNPQQGRN